MQNRKLPRVYPILDTRSAGGARHCVSKPPRRRCWRAARGILQIRHKGALEPRHLRSRARQWRGLCREAGARADRQRPRRFRHAARSRPARGPGRPGAARRPPADGPRRHASASPATTPAQLCAAAAEPVDYVALGPVFATASKRNPDPVVGVEEVRRCRALFEKPLVAIGGITLANALEVCAAGADSVAVIAGLLPETATAANLCANGWKNGNNSRQRSNQSSRAGGRHHAGDGLDDRLGRVHRGGGYCAPGAIAGPADADVVRHRGAHADRGAELRRAGRRHAARRRAVRLPARSLRAAVGLPVRLDHVPGDSDRHHRRRGRGLRQVRRRLLSVDLRRRTT